MRRYLVLLGVQMRASLQIAVQYRVDFFVGALMTLFWTVWGLLPLVFVWRGRIVAGWSMPEALLVVAWFTLLRGLLDGAVQPALGAVVEHIRKGTLDFVLLKPADAQFLVSTTRFVLVHVVDGIAAVVIAVYALNQLHHVPRPLDVGIAVALTVAAAALLYSVAILAVSVAFWVVRVDNLMYLFTSVFDAARWPSTVWRGALRVVFTFVVPLALMTTYPAEALLGRLPGRVAIFALVGAVLFTVAARQVWKRAIGHYTSASS